MKIKIESRQKLLDEVEDFTIRDDELDLPATDRDIITYKYDPKQNRFIVSDNSPLFYLVLGELSESEYEEDIRNVINNPNNLNFPSLIRRILFFLLFLGILLILIYVLLIILAILALDLVFLALSLYFIKESFKFLWIMKFRMIDLSRFSNLKKELKLLNEKYRSYDLEWTLNTRDNWLTLGKYNTDYSLIS